MMAWDKCFYMIEALMSFGVGSDFLSSGILPADRKTAAFTRARNIFIGGILLAGGNYFYFKAFDEQLAFISLIAAVSLIPCDIHWRNKQGGSLYEKLSRSGGLILFLMVIVVCFAIFIIRFCSTER